jgi:hypothetical protein
VSILLWIRLGYEIFPDSMSTNIDEGDMKGIPESHYLEEEGDQYQ